MSPLEFWVFLPQMRLSMAQLVERARAAEAAGFSGVAGMDHLTPPMAENQPMFEAMITNTWLASHTEHLRVGSLVLCDSFRHPAVLAREARKQCAYNPYLRCRSRKAARPPSRRSSIRWRTLAVSIDPRCSGNTSA